MPVEHEAPMLVSVGHVLAPNGNVAMRRMTTGGKEAGEGRVEVHCWPGKPKRNISSLNQTVSKTFKETKTKENATTE